MNRAAIITIRTNIVVREAIAAQFLVFLSGIKIGVKYRAKKKRLQNATSPLARTISAV